MKSCKYCFKIMYEQYRYCEDCRQLKIQQAMEIEEDNHPVIHDLDISHKEDNQK